MSALALSKAFGEDLEFTLIESSSIGRIGVGEATVPAIRDFIKSIDLDETELMAKSQATVKLGIRFDGWRDAGHTFYHPFSFFGMDAGDVPFIDILTYLRSKNRSHDIFDYSLPIALMKENKLAFAPKIPPSRLFNYDWAMHFDATLFADQLRNYAIKRNITHIDARIIDIKRDGQKGHVTALQLEDGRHIPGDIFVDCTGFRSLLLGDALNVGFKSYKDQLLCDRAVAISCEQKSQTPVSIEPYTISAAHSEGWRWRIPLQNRIGNGFLYASNFLSDQGAIDQLISGLEGDRIGEPRIIKFEPGHREKFWSHNVVAIGLSAGFLEPLESTSISLIQTAIDRLIAFFPKEHNDHVSAKEFNRRCQGEFDRLRDFILAHYILNTRKGDTFWDAVRDVEVPDSLSHKMDVFKRHGRIIDYEFETFFEPSWQAILMGMNVPPEGYARLTEHYTSDELETALARMRETIHQSIMNAGSHVDYIRHIKQLY